MLIKEILSQHRNDYSAIMECEHCKATQKDPYGYADSNYFDRVIPAMYCNTCNKNRAGNLKPTEISE